MNIGIICEFNPFHNGHLALIEAAKEKYPESKILCFMSGEYVQRGEASLLPSAVRSKTAILCGADAVFTLPCAYSLAPAQIYAKTIINLISHSGLCDVLAFGSESGDISSIAAVSDRLNCTAFENEVKKLVNECPYPVARAQAYMNLYGEELPKTPNDMLGYEYVSALKGTGIIPAVFKRKAGENIFSASDIRGDLSLAKKAMPELAYNELENAEKIGLVRDGDVFGKVILDKIIDAVEVFADVPPDFLPRMVKTARESKSYGEYLSKLSVKQYTRARIKRMTLCTALKIDKSEWEETPKFLRLSAVKKSATALLNMSKLPVLTKPSACEKICGKDFFYKEIRREAIASLSQLKPQSIADLYRFTPFIYNDTELR